MHNWLLSLFGGALIGLSATGLLWTHGRRAGITGIVSGALTGPKLREDWSWRLAFIAGLLSAGAAARFLSPEAFTITTQTSVGTALLAGAVAGFGARVGGGCTSGHGVCGLSALSLRSLVATLTFMTTAGITVFVVRHLLGGGS